MRIVGAERIALVVALLAAAVPAAHAAAPDSCQRAALQRRIGGLREVLLVGPAGEILLRQPLVDPDGIRMREPFHPPRPALIVVGELPAAPRPVERVAWSDIDSVQVHVGGDPGSITMGFVIGALVGVLISVPFSQVAAQMGVPKQVTFSLTGGLGGLFGAAFGAGVQHWRTVFPRLRGEQSMLPCGAGRQGTDR